MVTRVRMVRLVEHRRRRSEHSPCNEFASDVYRDGRRIDSKKQVFSKIVQLQSQARAIPDLGRDVKLTTRRLF